MNDMISSLLDSNLDDLADLPEFLIPPSGAYTARVISAGEKKVGTHPAVEFKFSLLSTVELTNEADTPVADGTETSIIFMLDNEYGVGGLKAFLLPIQQATGVKTVREAMVACVNMDILLVTTVRSGKKGSENEDKRYLGIHKVEVM